MLLQVRRSSSDQARTLQSHCRGESHGRFGAQEEDLVERLSQFLHILRRGMIDAVGYTKTISHGLFVEQFLESI